MAERSAHVNRRKRNSFSERSCGGWVGSIRTEVRGFRPTTSVLIAWVGVPERLQLGSWRGHARLHELHERFISRDEATDQEDERLIAGITGSVHDAGLLDDPLPWPQQHLWP